MRIISQNKDCDVQYEAVALFINSVNFEKVVVMACGLGELKVCSSTILGQYDTKQQAIDVLERIQEHYDSICKSKFHGYTEAYYVPEIFEMP